MQKAEGRKLERFTLLLSAFCFKLSA